jgi:hypothetical protein
MKPGEAGLFNVRRALTCALGFASALTLMVCAAPNARADRIENGVAVFSALDKVTATIKKLEVPINETMQFGALKVTPRACYSRPPTEQPNTTTFVEVNEVMLDGQEKKLFSGWMFAESPGLNAVEHPVFDVWLTECQKPKRSVAQQQQAPQPGVEPDPNAAPSADDAYDSPRRRVRR